METMKIDFVFGFYLHLDMVNLFRSTYFVLMHVNSSSVTGFHSIYCPNVEVRVYDN